MTDQAGAATATLEASASDGTNDASVDSSTGTQTRFSFYNAKDFIQKSPPPPPPAAAEQQQGADDAAAARSGRSGVHGDRQLSQRQQVPSAAGVPAETVPTRFSFQDVGDSTSDDEDDDDDEKKQQYSGGPAFLDRRQKHPQDSVQILRSLQEHEIQRLDILGGGAAADADGADADVNGLAEVLDGPDLHLPSNSVVPVGATANPYEDAIKEALDLLRKHRTALSVSGAASTATADESASDAAAAAQQQPLNLRQQLNVSTSSRLPGERVRTPAEADQVLKARGAGQGRAAQLVVVPGATASVPSVAPSPAASDAQSASSASLLLGDAYQAEIEARRKQRQERMAKYASRLAELKQQEDSNSWVSQSVASANADTPSSGQFPWEDSLANPNSSNYTKSDRPFQVLADNTAAATSEAGSVSTITATKDDEVQRGVEKVLLAILERANSSNCRSTQAGEGSVASGTASSARDGGEGGSGTSGVQSKSSWQQGEEKKSNAENDDENSLLKAMSDLLKNGGTEQQPAPGIPSFSKEEPAPSPRDLKVGQSHETFDPVTASRSADDDTSAIPSPASDTGPFSHHRRHMEPPRTRETDVSSLATPVAGSKNSYSTELADTSGGVEAVASDDPPPHMNAASDELDELIRKFSGKDEPRETGNIQPDPIIAPMASDARPKPSREDPIDQRVRRILDENDTGDDLSSHSPSRSDADPYSDGTATDDYDDDDSTDRTPSSHGSSSSSSRTEEDESISATSYDDETATDITDDDDDVRNDTIDGVLGPLNQTAGGRTGVVLEPDSPKNEAPSILESLSAAMSLVTGNASTSGIKDKYSSTEDDDDSVDSEANELMRSLCAHLLPVGVNRPESKLLGKPPAWDDANPEEPGYRIVRLTNHQLRRVEREFESMVEKLSKNSEQNLRKDGGSDSTFERDLQAAEDLLDQEEERLKAAESDVVVAENSSNVASIPSNDASLAVKENVSEEEDEDVSGELANFPGVKTAGKGEMGDLEYFHLPIIFKSHVTGFEPTKDLFLEAGNIVAGQYLVEGELGSAAFSTAYRCIDLNSEDGNGPDGHEEVCLKVIKNTKDFFDQSLDEIKILELLRQTGKCQEKAIVEMKTFFYHREHLIIVTELLRQNLFEFGKFIVEHDEEPYFTIPRLAYVTRQILVALDFVHSLGLVHSDVKPENILLGSYSRAQVKLIDFGSSCYLTDRQSSYIQSRSYRAPEVVLGLPYDGRIDVWSCGCVLAEMFTGDVTFQNDSIVSMLSRIEAICGPFPRHMIGQGRQSGRFFTKCGLLFERAVRQEDGADTDSVATGDDGAIQHFDIFQPKVTSLSARLGFESDLMELFDSGKKLSAEQEKRAVFVDFVRKLLTIDSETRPTAAQALQHPWMEYASTLTEEDIKYPST